MSEARSGPHGNRRPGSEPGELLLPPPVDLLPRSDRVWVVCPAGEAGLRAAPSITTRVAVRARVWDCKQTPGPGSALPSRPSSWLSPGLEDRVGRGVAWLRTERVHGLAVGPTSVPLWQTCCGVALQGGLWTGGEGAVLSTSPVPPGGWQDGAAQADNHVAGEHHSAIHYSYSIAIVPDKTG
ncbi:hypothetical protein NDU88_003048 [Pleurodeles waltl]|uniref:Uncharacterized protein n=1 Tax=Pleurodeles waltl TaxID=8319 RepID=A0AAV7KXG3_PLEWA|nr:hypothetical protein NDU88_003048 [Pleurodeles waltl]